ERPLPGRELQVLYGPPCRCGRQRYLSQCRSAARGGSQRFGLGAGGQLRPSLSTGRISLVSSAARDDCFGFCRPDCRDVPQLIERLFTPSFYAGWTATSATSAGAGAPFGSFTTRT